MSTRDNLVAAFESTFGRAPAVVSRAPGRLEILGNHTDYNEGFVISAAIDRSTFVAASPLPTGPCRLASRDQAGEATFELAALAEKTSGHWSNYVKGVIVAMQARGVQPQPFAMMIAGDVPLGAGMSSSAALEIAAAYALAKLWGASFDAAEYARIGQEAENRYVGANTGLLDQFTSINGRENELVLTDFRSLAVERVTCPSEAVFVVADSGVKHDLTLEYNERRQRCEEAAAYFAERLPGVTHLRDVTMAQLEAARADLHHLTWRRACHVIGECERVQQGRAALAAGDLATFGRLLSESHQSSRDNFENSCPELDILVAIGSSLPGGLGARLSGGGFGGISIHLVHRAEADTYRQRLATAYELRVGREPMTMICAIGEGAELYV